MNPVARSLIQTLAYSDIFNYPLTSNEIYQRLISPTLITQKQVTQTLETLVHNGLIKRTGSYYHLPGKAKAVAQRLVHTRHSTIKLHQAQKVAAKLITLPYVKSVLLTGTVAVNNASAEDDIDLMIITAANSLWSTRLNVTLWLEWQGLRRRPHQDQASNKMCVNLYLSETNLAVPKTKRNLYTAFEVFQVKPLCDPYHLHYQFLKQNHWITSFLGNAEPVLPATSPLPTSQLHAPVWYERSLYQLQRLYMKPRRTRELIDPHHAYFHPRDLASDILSLYNKKVESYLHV